MDLNRKLFKSTSRKYRSNIKDTHTNNNKWTYSSHFVARRIQLGYSYGAHQISWALFPYWWCLVRGVSWLCIIGAPVDVAPTTPGKLIKILNNISTGIRLKPVPKSKWFRPLESALSRYQCRNVFRYFGIGFKPIPKSERFSVLWNQLQVIPKSKRCSVLWKRLQPIPKSKLFGNRSTADSKVKQKSCSLESV